jgi:hypothetical protein
MQARRGNPQTDVVRALGDGALEVRDRDIRPTGARLDLCQQLRRRGVAGVVRERGLQALPRTIDVAGTHLEDREHAGCLRISRLQLERALQARRRLAGIALRRFSQTAENEAVRIGRSRLLHRLGLLQRLRVLSGAEEIEDAEEVLLIRGRAGAAGGLDLPRTVVGDLERHLGQAAARGSCRIVRGDLGEPLQIERRRLDIARFDDRGAEFVHQSGFADLLLAHRLERFRGPFALPEAGVRGGQQPARRLARRNACHEALEVLCRRLELPAGERRDARDQSARRMRESREDELAVGTSRDVVLGLNRDDRAQVCGSDMAGVAVEDEVEALERVGGLARHQLGAGDSEVSVEALRPHFDDLEIGGLGLRIGCPGVRDIALQLEHAPRARTQFQGLSEMPLGEAHVALREPSPRETDVCESRPRHQPLGRFELGTRGTDVIQPEARQSAQEVCRFAIGCGVDLGEPQRVERFGELRLQQQGIGMGPRRALAVQAESGGAPDLGFGRRSIADVEVGLREAPVRGNAVGLLPPRELELADRLANLALLDQGLSALDMPVGGKVRVVAGPEQARDHDGHERRPPCGQPWLRIHWSLSLRSGRMAGHAALWRVGA